MKYYGEEKTAEFMRRVYENRFSIMDISENAMSHKFEYQCLDKYYSDTQPIGKLHKVKVPTMFLSALDDPTINPIFNPYKEFENNEHIIGVITSRGGHCGHLSGGLLPKQWFPAPMLEFLDYLESKSR